MFPDTKPSRHTGRHICQKFYISKYRFSILGEYFPVDFANSLLSFLPELSSGGKSSQ